MKYRTKLTLKIYWQHVRKYKFTVFFALLCTITGAMVELAGPLFYKRLFDVIVSSPKGELVPGQLFTILFLVIGAYVVSLILQRSAGFMANYWVSNTMKDLADTCFAYLHKHSFSFFHNNFVGSLVKRVGRFYHAFGALHAIIMWDMVPLVVNVCVVVVVLFFENAIFGWILVGWIIFFVFLSHRISQVLFKYYIRRSEIDSLVTGYLADTVSNQSNLKLFTGYDRERDGFGSLARLQQQSRKTTWDLSSFSETIQALLMIVLEFTIVYVAIRLWFRGLLSVGAFVLIQAYLITIFHRFWNLGRQIRDIYEQLAEAEEMTEIFDTPHEIEDRKNAKELVVTAGEILFDKVSFYYHRTRPVIKDLTLLIRPGERVALVGSSGAGKSTIVKLLLRQHDITSGRILIDGQRTSHVTQESLWSAMSLVPQDPLLFHRTLTENIRYGKPDASEEDVVKAAIAAHAHEFISEFPEGYNTYVGERGVKLSGGERQRVAIARAILRNAPILILDEATSSLDSHSEGLIQDALEILMKTKTTIVIAHRLSTIMKMDRILVVGRGGVLEEGSHQELLKKKKGTYKRLWELQAGGFV